jgi:hypothetical protein
MDKLPEEIRLEVLQCAGAIISEKDFCRVSEKITKESEVRRKGLDVHFSYHETELKEWWFAARAINVSLVLVCESWNRLFTPYLYSTFCAMSRKSSRSLLETLTFRKDYALHIRQIIIGRPVGEVWLPNYPVVVEEIVTLCPRLTTFIVVYRDDLMYEAQDYILPLSSTSLPQRTHRDWNHLRLLKASNLLWESFAAYIVAVAESSTLEYLHLDRVDGTRADVVNARQFLQGRRVLSALQTLNLTYVDPPCLHLLQSFQFPQLRSFTFQCTTVLPTDAELGTFIGPVFYNLEYLSLPYGVLQSRAVALPQIPHSHDPKLETLILTTSPHSDFKAPKFPRIPLHRVRTLQVTGVHEPSYDRDIKGFDVWVRGMCDTRRMPRLRQLQTDIRPSNLSVEQREFLRSRLEKPEAIMKQNYVTLKVLDASQANFENLSASLEAMRSAEVLE